MRRPRMVAGRGASPTRRVGRRLGPALLVGLLGACQHGVEVTVTGRPALRAPASLRVTVDDGVDRVTEDLELDARDVLPLTFVVETTGRDGAATLTVEGRDGDDQLVGRGVGEVPLGEDAATTLTLEPADFIAERSEVVGDQRLAATDLPYGARQLAAGERGFLLAFESSGTSWGRLFDDRGLALRNATNLTDQEFLIPEADEGGTVAVTHAGDRYGVVWQPVDRGGLADPRTVLDFHSYGPDTGERLNNADLQISLDNATAARLPAIAGFPDGRCAVAWLAAVDRAASVGEVRLRIVDGTLASPAAVGVGGADRIGTDAPAVAVLADGGIVVVWSVAGGGGTGRLLARVFDGTAPRTAQLELAEPGATAQVRQGFPQVAALPDGGLVVAWYEERPTGSTIQLRWFDAGGGARGAPVEVASVPDQRQTPALIATAALGVVVAWTTGPAVDRDVLYRRFALDGGARGEAQPLATTVAGVQRQPSLAPLGAGFVGAWTDESATGADPSGAAVRARVLYVDGP